MDPKTKIKLYIPYTYLEKKKQKRLLLSHLKHDRENLE